jgi:heme-degrading monooxygenase HmoA
MEMEQIFIDRFIVPQNAKLEFMERMAINRNYIKTLPGFIRDEAFESLDEAGNFLCITIAVWASGDAIKNAKALVQAEYQRQGFNLPAMLQRLEIRMERGLYHRLSQ